jgi:hypothetical protein
MIEMRNHLVLAPTSAWNAPPPTGSLNERKVKSIVIPHTAWCDAVLAIDVMGVRKFGTDNVYETIQERVLDKPQRARDSFDATDEFRQLNALKGIVLDADGTSELFDSFDFFGVTQKTIQLDVTNTAADSRKAVDNYLKYPPFKIKPTIIK